MKIIFGKKTKKELPGFKKPGIVNKRKHWHIILASFFITFLVMVAVNAFVFIQISSESLFQAPPVEPPIVQTFSTAKLEEVVAMLEQKRATQQEVLREPSTFSNPAE